MAKPPVPVTLDVVTLAEQTLEQLQVEQAWWQYMAANSREETKSAWAAERLAAVEAAIAELTP